MSRPVSKYLGGGLHVSASSLRVLMDCPYQFLLQYLRGLPREQVSSRMILGTAIHAALEVYYRAVMEGTAEPGLEELVDGARESLGEALGGQVPVAFEGGEGPDELVEECRRVLKAFLDKPYKPHKILGVEVPFGLPLADLATGEVVYDELVVGFLDLVVEDEDGVVAIVDHKVSSRFAPPKRSDMDIQLGLYGWAADQLVPTPVRLRHHVLVRGKKGVRQEIVDIPRSDRDALEAFESACSGLELIHLAVEHPRPERLLGRRRSWRCGGCAYGNQCGNPASLSVAACGAAA